MNSADNAGHSTKDIDFDRVNWPSPRALVEGLVPQLRLLKVPVGVRKIIRQAKTAWR